ncbi:MAG: hypothetical protein ABIU55_11730 [Ferruginibacter sp.]
MASHRLSAQTTCPNKPSYQTKFISDGSPGFRLPYSLVFEVVGDSLYIREGANSKVNFLEFKILSKRCSWNTDFTFGNATYQLEIFIKEKKEVPILNIIIKEAGITYIELLYPDSEKRIFESQ